MTNINGLQELQSCLLQVTTIVRKNHWKEGKDHKIPVSGSAPEDVQQENGVTCKKCNHNITTSKLFSLKLIVSDYEATFNMIQQKI